MKKLGMILGVAAVAVVAGCKDAEYNYKRVGSQDEVKTAATEEAAPAPEVKEVKPEFEADVEETKVEDVKPVEPEYTEYIVQRGDYLAKISKKYNLTIDSIKKANSMKTDTIRLGQKIKLPGKIDVGVQTVPEVAKAKPGAKADKGSSYAGATKEYVVKSGDTLGVIAYGNGINIRQLKALNGLTSDKLRIGQKLKVPANGRPVAKKTETKSPAVETKPAKPVVENLPPEPPMTNDVVADPAAVAPVVETLPADGAAAAPSSAVAPAAELAPATYVVQEGDDLTAVTLRWGVTKSAICELNNLAEDAQLTPGQILKLPADAQL